MRGIWIGGASKFVLHELHAKVLKVEFKTLHQLIQPVGIVESCGLSDLVP